MATVALQPALKRRLDDGAGPTAASVLENSDLLRLICLNNLSPSNFCALRRVSRVFRDLLDGDDGILGAVLHYQGQMLKTELRSFMCLPREVLNSLPCTKHPSYVLYGDDAFKLLGGKGCAARLAERRRGDVGRRLRGTHIRILARHMHCTHAALPRSCQSPTK